MPRDARKILFDVLTSITAIEDFTTAKTIDDYRVNRMLRSAVEREYEIIGEAVRRLEVDFEDIFRRITDGRKMIDFRNLLIHGYDSVSDEIVWSIISNNLGILKNEARALFEEFE